MSVTATMTMTMMEPASLANLGEGPKRFALVGERTLEKQMEDLTEEQRACINTLRKKWAKASPGHEPYDDAMLLRFSRNSPGKTKFNPKTAIKTMKNFDRRYKELRVTDMESQLLTMTMFPVPGLVTKDGGHATLYIRASRFFPKRTPTSVMIKNVAYCMETAVEAEKECTEGIAMMINLDDWSMENFSFSFSVKFIMMLQGKVPIRIRSILVVNPPSWFDRVWNMLVPIMSRELKAKIRIIQEDKLSNFFDKGYETYLPDDMTSGKAPTGAMVQDYITYRKHIEAKWDN